jgi:hypothetical protein
MSTAFMCRSVRTIRNCSAKETMRNDGLPLMQDDGIRIERPKSPGYRRRDPLGRKTKTSLCSFMQLCSYRVCPSFSLATTKRRGAGKTGEGNPVRSINPSLWTGSGGVSLFLRLEQAKAAAVAWTGLQSTTETNTSVEALFCPRRGRGLPVY